MMSLRLISGLATLLWMTSASAQSVQQSGNVTPGHVPVWVAPGVVKDGGPATAGTVTELGITKNGGLPFCISTGNGLVSGAGYDQMCLSVTLNGAARIDVNSHNGAASIPFIIALNGTQIFTSGSLPAQIPTIVQVNSGASTTAPAVFDVTVAWNSSSASVKTTTIPACAPALAGFKVTIKDEIGTAASFPLLSAPSSGTIEGFPSYTIYNDKASITFQCDGVNNWMGI